jgi:hypothetical protein
MSYCGVAPLAARPAILVIGIRGGTPADPVTGAAPTLVAGNAAAAGLAAAGTAVQACGTDNGPIETALPMPADTAAPPPPKAGAEPNAVKASPPVIPEPAALTPEAVTAVVEPIDFAIEFSEFIAVMGVVAKYAAFRSGIASVFNALTADSGDGEDDVDARLCVSGLVAVGGSVNGVNVEAAPAAPAYPYIAAAFWAHISP